MDKIIQNLKDQDVVRDSTSPFSSPAFLVLKMDTNRVHLTLQRIDSWSITEILTASVFPIAILFHLYRTLRSSSARLNLHRVERLNLHMRRALTCPIVFFSNGDRRKLQEVHRVFYGQMGGHHELTRFFFFNPLTTIGSYTTQENSPRNSPDFATSPARSSWPACSRHTAACMHRFFHILGRPGEPAVWFMSESGAVGSWQARTYVGLPINSSGFETAAVVRGLTQFLCRAICTQRTPKGPK